MSSLRWLTGLNETLTIRSEIGPHSIPCQKFTHSLNSRHLNVRFLPKPLQPLHVRLFAEPGHLPLGIIPGIALRVKYRLF